MSAPKPRKGEVGPFPHDVKPVRPGVYRWNDGYIDIYRRWVGDRWLRGELLPSDAMKKKDKPVNTVFPLRCDYWFGLERPE